MLILNSNDVKQALSMPVAIEGMKQAFAALTRGDVVMPNRTSVDIARHEAVALIMPSHIAGEHEALAVKVANVFPGNASKGLANVQAVVNFFDPATGQPIALIEGAALTGIRTAAASAAATDFIAPPAATVLGIVGAGAQGRTHIESICAVRAIERIQIYGPNREKVERLAAEVKTLPNVPTDVVVVDSGDAAATDADIVCAVTSSSEPVFADGAIKPGAHLNAIGSYQPHTREVPPETVVRSLVYVDQREAAWEEAGDLIQPLQAGLIPKDHIVADLGELATGTVPTKPTGNQISFFKSVGLAMQDAFVARICFERAIALGLGQTVAWK